MKIKVFFYFVGDMEYAEEIYNNLFNSRPVTDHDTWKEYDLEGNRFALHFEEKKLKINNFSNIQNTTGGIISFQVENIQEALNHAEKFGFKIYGKIQNEPFGYLGDISDPWGNLINFVQYK